MADLRPYVCTFVECAHDPSKLYSRKSTWFEHELTFHRRRWECSLGCSKDFSSQAELKNHIHEKHPDIQDITLLQSLLAGREVAARSEAKCPFCSNALKSRKHTRQHIANHQKQIALRALYSMRILSDESNGESDQESDRVSMLSADSAQEVRTNSVPSEGLQPDEPQGFPVPSTTSVVVNPALSTQRSAEAMEIETKMVEAQATAHREALIKTLSNSHTRSERESLNQEKPDAHKTKGSDKPAQTTRNSSKPLFSEPARWFLVHSFDFSFESDVAGLCLGQVLLDARDSGSFLLDSALPVPLRLRIDISVKDQVRISRSGSLSRSINAWAAAIFRTTAERLRSEQIDISAKSVERRVFHPDEEYIRDVINLEPLQQYLRQGSFTSSRRLFMVVGVQIASRLVVAYSEADQDQSTNVEDEVAITGGVVPVSAAIVSAGVVPVSAGVTRMRSTIKSHDIEGPIVLMYSLMEIKWSFLGNVMTGPYHKGAMM